MRPTVLGSSDVRIGIQNVRGCSRRCQKQKKRKPTTSLQRGVWKSRGEKRTAKWLRLSPGFWNMCEQGTELTAVWCRLPGINSSSCMPLGRAQFPGESWHSRVKPTQWQGTDRTLGDQWALKSRRALPHENPKSVRSNLNKPYTLGRGAIMLSKDCLLSRHLNRSVC